MDWLDGTISTEHEEELFSALHKSKDVRIELNQFLRIRTAIHNDSTAFIPSPEDTTAIFTKLGFAPPSTIHHTQPTDNSSMLFMENNNNPFLGYAHVSDIEHQDFKVSRTSIESFAAQFSSLFPFWGTSAYIWPVHPLYAWSRIWEYPFIVQTIAHLEKKNTILDVGSATTFLPYYLAETHQSMVVGLDPDPYHVHHFTACSHEVQQRLGVQRLPIPVQASGDAIPFPDEYFDVIYSVSVIEHIPNPLPTVQEMYRVLQHGGTLILTLDVNYPFGTNATGLSESALTAFIEMLGKLFQIVLPIPEPFVSQDILTLQNSPMRSYKPPQLPLRYYLRSPDAIGKTIISKLRRIFTSQQQQTETPDNLVVLAIILKKP